MQYAHHTLCLTVITSQLLSAVASAGDTEYRISAAKGPYFPCDERVTEDRWLADRFVVPLKKYEGNPLVVKEYDWEGTGPLMDGSVLYDPKGSLYRMWYGVWNSHNYFNNLPFSYNVCYAESKDGIHWKKPALGVFEHQADPRNNYIRLGTDKTQAIDVCLNPRPDKYPGKFLAIHNQKGGVFVSHSEDGKAFTFLQNDPAIPYHSDTHNNFVYDEVRDRWLLFCRPRAYAGDHKRRVSVQTSRDLRKWTHERTILVPTETEKPEFYGMTVFRRGDLLWGVIQVYDRTTGFMHGELAWSGDGEHWTKLPTHPAFLARGPQGAWDYGMVTAADAPLVDGNTMRFYYGGFALDHNQKDNPAAIGLATAERDRLVGLRPRSGQIGYVLTRPFEVGGRKVFLNAKIAGILTGELRTDGNRTIKGWSFDDCDPITESGFERELTWRGASLSQCPVQEVRILFRLDNAALFTFDLRP